MDSDSILFPYTKIRPVQDLLISDVQTALKEKRSLIVHAPTGLGKTAGVLSPALTFALKNELSVIFLTSRHTQHTLALETLKRIRERHGINITVTDIIGKKWMCAQENVFRLSSSDFVEYCKSMKDADKCVYYSNTKSGARLSVPAKKILQEIKTGINHTEEVIETAKKSELCPYEITLAVAVESKIIIADYYYVFHPVISNHFLNRTQISLSKCIIIVDEAHNLPMRIRDLASTTLSSYIIRKAIKEAKKYSPSLIPKIVGIQDILNTLASGKGEVERLVEKKEFIKMVDNKFDYEEIIEEFENAAALVRQEQKQSFLGAISRFFDTWQKTNEGFARIISNISHANLPMVTLSNICLDPSIVSRGVMEDSYSVIMMSGTLSPTSMYRDILGVYNPIERSYKSPFPNKNRINLIIPLTTTKFSRRTDDEYKKIADVVTEVVNEVPGNSIVFFPSYKVRDIVFEKITGCRKKMLLEMPNLTKEGKETLLDEFKKLSDNGAVLLAVVAGSFGEGIDLPGDLLKCVVIVGLPLEKPDLETRELIKYYDSKFGKGWDYGYVFPAFNKALQNAGRCIRSENDKGVIVFLDERYLWPNYYRCFPSELELKVTKEFKPIIREFFKQGLNK
ncbi:MAG: ATP-dependent DNA helicase [Candidatus Woesearchaeota archaeon]